MIYLLVFMLIFPTLGMVWCCIEFIRNDKVAAYRRHLLQVAYDNDWENMRAEYDAIDYQIMVIQFWKSLDSFYEGTKLLEASKKRN